ncbi:hypothetical protein HYW46_00910 [Candidatus Daviesbacteria bacterium]|nr:hypothetical protein [Candidatus Daviesbacteria bacterium]
METKFKFLKQTKIQVLIIVLLTLLAYSNIFQNEFAVDDLYLIVKWERIHNLSIIPELFVKDTLETGYTGYRPLRTTIIAILYNIFRENTFGYHLYSILVHLSSTLLVYFLARQLIQGLGFRGWGLGLEVKTKKNSTIPYTLPQRGKLRLYPIPFISALLFGLHPIHT